MFTPALNPLVMENGDKCGGVFDLQHGGRSRSGEPNLLGHVRIGVANRVQEGPGRLHSCLSLLTLLGGSEGYAGSELFHGWSGTARVFVLWNRTWCHHRQAGTAQPTASFFAQDCSKIWHAP